MPLLCKIGFHDRITCWCYRCHTHIHAWSGCKCSRCNASRDQRHEWDGCRCSVCGQIREQGHAWVGCTCSQCGSTRDQEHSWQGCKCSKCNSTRNREHSWEGCKCSKCGRTREHKWQGSICVVCGAIHPATLEDAVRRLGNALRQSRSYKRIIRAYRTGNMAYTGPEILPLSAGERTLLFGRREKTQALAQTAIFTVATATAERMVSARGSQDVSSAVATDFLDAARAIRPQTEGVNAIIWWLSEASDIKIDNIPFESRYRVLSDTTPFQDKRAFLGSKVDDDLRCGIFWALEGNIMPNEAGGEKLISNEQIALVNREREEKDRRKLRGW